MGSRRRPTDQGGEGAPAAAQAPLGDGRRCRCSSSGGGSCRQRHPRGWTGSRVVDSACLRTAVDGGGDAEGSCGVGDWVWRVAVLGRRGPRGDPSSWSRWGLRGRGWGWAGGSLASPNAGDAGQLGAGWYSGLAVARDGAVYFTEAGLVREVTPSGMLVTVAGGGTAKLGRRPVNAMEADLSIRGDGLTGLAIGPGGELYALCRCRHSAYRPAQPPIMFLGRGLP